VVIFFKKVVDLLCGVWYCGGMSVKQGELGGDGDWTDIVNEGLDRIGEHTDAYIFVSRSGESIFIKTNLMNLIETSYLVELAMSIIKRKAERIVDSVVTEDGGA
jgi:hypothetical protein